MKRILHQKAKIIQDFLDNKVLKYRKDQKALAQDKLKKLLRDHLVNKQLRPYMRDFVNKIKLDKMFDLMSKYIFKKFRFNLNNFDKLKMMSHLFKIPKSIVEKNLRNRFNLWRNKADALKRNEAADKIQKNFGKFKSGKRNRLISEKVENITTRLALRHSDIRKYCLRLWASNVGLMKIKESAKKINDFVADNWQNRKLRKRWHNMANQLCMKNHMIEALNLFDRYKKWKALNPLFKRFDNKIKKDGYEQFKNNYKGA
jgi:hypothetical protein